MATQYYTYLDSGAPSLNAAAGTLINVLNFSIANNGWTNPYNGINTAVYKQGTGSSGCYVQVVDAGLIPVSTLLSAQMFGFETMTAVSTGTNPFPTTAQSSIGVVVRKANSLTATNIPWIVICDPTCFYLITYPAASSTVFYPATYGVIHMFGDINSEKTNDTYKCAIIGYSADEATYTQTHDSFTVLNSAIATTAELAAYIQRSYDGTTLSVAIGKHIDYIKVGTVSGYSASSITFPDYVNRKAYFSPVYVHHNSAYRGRLKGYWAIAGNVCISATQYYDWANTTINNTENLGGHTFKMIGIYNLSVNTYRSNYIFDVSTNFTW